MGKKPGAFPAYRCFSSQTPKLIHVGRGTFSTLNSVAAHRHRPSDRSGHSRRHLVDYPLFREAPKAQPCLRYAPLRLASLAVVTTDATLTPRRPLPVYPDQQTLSGRLSRSVWGPTGDISTLRQLA